MSKSKKKEPITLVEIVVNTDDNFEIRLKNVTPQSVPVMIGLLEKAKFDLCAKEFFDEPEELPVNFMNSKFDA